MRHLPLILLPLLLAACPAPPTQEQVTSRAVLRNCEVQAATAANEIKQQNVQVVKEGGTTSQSDNEEVAARAAQVQKKTFDSCMLKYAL